MENQLYLFPEAAPAMGGEPASQRGPDSADLPLADLVQQYLDHVRATVCPQHFQNIRRFLLDFLKHIGNQRTLADCRQHDLTSWLAGHPTWRSNWTRRSALASVLACFHWLADEQIIARSPYRRPRSLRLPTPHTGRPMTGEELQRLLAAAEPELADIIRFLALTGRRPIEARSLQWEGEISRVDFRTRVIYLFRHKTSRMQKQSRPILVPMTEAVYSLLGTVRARQQSAGEVQAWVFLRRGKPWTKRTFNACFRAARQRAGLPPDCVPYGLRHRFGTELVLAGVELKVVSEVLGHTSARTTERYVHLAGQVEHLRRAVERVRDDSLPPGQGGLPQLA